MTTAHQLLDTAIIWYVAEAISSLVLLAALVLMVKFYEEYLEAGIKEMRDWKLIVIGFAFYITIKTHISVFVNVMGTSLSQLPVLAVSLIGITLVVASMLVFLGFYGLVKDYL